MALLFWDASALSKRYTEEVGFETVDALFANVPLSEMSATAWGYLETYSILVRRLNGGILDRPTFTAAVTALQAEVVNSTDFGLLPISDPTVFASVATIQKHNLNATDAAILTTLLEFVNSSGVTDCVIVASDKRLLRAANAEGLETLNPEDFPAVDVPTFLANL